jgi:hypothetical protein
VWRAANGINPQDPQPTGGTQLETLRALWKQRLDRDVALATYPQADARTNKRQAGRTALNRSDDRQDAPHLIEATTGSAHTKNPNGARAGQPHPAGSRTGSTRRAFSHRWAAPLQRDPIMDMRSSFAGSKPLKASASTRSWSSRLMYA